LIEYMTEQEKTDKIYNLTISGTGTLAGITGRVETYCCDAGKQSRE